MSLAPEHFRICLLGDRGVGKSWYTMVVLTLSIAACWTTRVMTNLQFTQKPEYNPGCIVDDRQEKRIDGRTCLIQLMNTAAGEEYARLRELSIRDADAFVLACDVTSRQSFDHVEPIWWAEAIGVKSKFQVQPNLPASLKNGVSKTPLAIVMGNKCDLGTAREVSQDEGAALAKRLGCLFLETSAKENRNVDESLHRLVREIRLDIEREQAESAWTEGDEMDLKAPRRSRIQRLASSLFGCTED